MFPCSTACNGTGYMGRNRLLPPPPPRPKGLVRPGRGATLESGLTEKQDKFCQEVASGLSLAEAYRRAYATDGMAPRTIYNNASALFSRDDISGKVFALQAQKRRGTMHDYAQAKDFALARLQHEAEQAEQPAARIRAIELIMRHHGLLSDKPQEAVDPYQGLDAASLRLAIQERLLAALGPVQDGTDDDTEDMGQEDTLDDTGYDDTGDDTDYMEDDDIGNITGNR